MLHSPLPILPVGVPNWDLGFPRPNTDVHSTPNVQRDRPHSRWSMRQPDRREVLGGMFAHSPADTTFPRCRGIPKKGLVDRLFKKNRALTGNLRRAWYRSDRHVLRRL